MKKILAFLLWLLSIPLFAQINHGGTPESFLLDNTALETPRQVRYQFSESEIKDNHKLTYRIGAVEKVQIDMWQEGTQTLTSNGDRILRLKILVENCPAVGLDFSNFHIPKGARLYAYNESQRFVLGAYTYLNNKENGKFAIQSIPGDHMILEYNAPASITETPKLQINRIGKFYRDLAGNDIHDHSQGRSDECYEDVHCKANIEVERSVMRWRFYDEDAEGYAVCSCNMIDQDVAINNIKPYVLSANHCGKDADLSTSIFYFNYNNSSCGATDASLSTFTQVGASQIAKRWFYDMFLMELDQFPPADYNFHMAGWDRSSNGNLTDDMMGISHPHGDEKVLSLGEKVLNSNPNFWRVRYNVNDSPTHPGSSGSPLFEDDNDRVIGFLSYGFAECDNTDGAESYGKLRKAWTSISSSTRLRDWLDPDDNDLNAKDGRDPCFTNLLLEDRTLISAEQNYQPENLVIIQAGQNFETAGDVVIEDDAEYKFTAGTQILLKPGFHTENGANFLGRIEGCDQVAARPGWVSSAIATYEEEPGIENALGKSIGDTDDGLKVQPNPSKGIFIVSLEGSQEEVFDLRIYNLQGILVYQTNQVKTGDHRIDLTHLTNGMYMLSTQNSAGEIMTKAILKE